MTPEEVLDLATGKRLILHKETVFFNERDEAVVKGWQELGCRVEPFYDEKELAARQAKGRETFQGWEVHLIGACEPIWETDDDGNEVNVTRGVLYEMARARIEL